MISPKSSYLEKISKNQPIQSPSGAIKNKSHYAKDKNLKNNNETLNKERCKPQKDNLSLNHLTLPSSFQPLGDNLGLSSSANRSYTEFFDVGLINEEKIRVHTFNSPERGNPSPHYSLTSSPSFHKKAEKGYERGQVESQFMKIEEDYCPSPGIESNKNLSKTLSKLAKESKQLKERINERANPINESIDRYDFYSDSFSLKTLANPQELERVEVFGNDISKRIWTETVNNYKKRSSSQDDEMINEQTTDNKKSKRNSTKDELLSFIQKESPKFNSQFKRGAYMGDLVYANDNVPQPHKGQFAIEKALKAKRNLSEEKISRKSSSSRFKESSSVSNLRLNSKNPIEGFTKASLEVHKEDWPKSGHKDSTSKLKNLLIEPRSNDYGKFAKIYKGLENKDSWKFDFTRFKKLGRGASPKENQTNNPNTEKPKPVYNVGSWINPDDSPYKLEEVTQREVNKTVTPKKVRAPPAEKANHQREEISRNWDRESFFKDESKKINESSSTSTLKNNQKKQDENKVEKDVCGDTLDFLYNLKEKGLLNTKVGKDNIQIDRMLEGLRKEVRQLNSTKDGTKREELEGKLLFLLDMTVQDLATLVAKKNKTFEKLQEKW